MSVTAISGERKGGLDSPHCEKAIRRETEGWIYHIVTNAIKGGNVIR
jgi:hypothetical protein